MIDGTTDKAQLSQEAGLHRIFNMKTYVPEEIVLGLSQLQSENAEGVFQSLKAMYLGYGIDLDVIRNSVIGATMDGASVNMGEHSSVKTRLINLVTQAIVIHCVNHSLELVVSYAMKGHQVLEDCIGTLEEVFKFYYYSPKEYRHLRAVADTFGVIIDHFGGLKQLRWCASQHRA